MNVNRKNLGDILMESGLVSEAEISEAIRRQRTSGRRLGVELCEMGLCTSEDVERALAIQFAMPFVHLTPGQVDPEAARLISAELAVAGTLVPTWAVGETVHVVMADPTNEDIVDRLVAETGGQVQISLGVPSEIRQAIAVVYGSAPSGPPPSTRFQSSLFTADEVRAVNADDSGRTFIHTLLAKVAAASCRGVLLEPTASGGGRIRFRSATDWREVATCSREWYLEIEAQLERLGRVETAPGGHLKEGRLPAREVGGGERIVVWEQAEGRITLIVPALAPSLRLSIELADPAQATATLTTSDAVILVDSGAAARALATDCLTAALTGDGRTVLAVQAHGRRLPTASEPGTVLRLPSERELLREDWERVRDLPFDWVVLTNAGQENPLPVALDLCLRRQHLATALAGPSADAVAARLLRAEPEADRLLPGLALLHVVAVSTLCRDCRQELTVPAAVRAACRVGDELALFAPGGCPSCAGTGYSGERRCGEVALLGELVAAAAASERPGSVAAWLRARLEAGEVAVADYLELAGGAAQAGNSLAARVNMIRE